MGCETFVAIFFYNGLGLRVMVLYATFQQYFSYIVAVSFISGGNWSTHRPVASH